MWFVCGECYREYQAPKRKQRCPECEAALVAMRNQKRLRRDHRYGDAAENDLYILDLSKSQKELTKDVIAARMMGMSYGHWRASGGYAVNEGHKVHTDISKKQRVPKYPNCWATPDGHIYEFNQLLREFSAVRRGREQLFVRIRAAEVSVAHMVMMAFDPDNYKEKRRIYFLDGNPLNCAFSNLTWIDPEGGNG